MNQPGKEIAASSQPLSKGKEIMPKASGKKARKNAGSGKGKSKVIFTGHRAAQQEAWLKRGSVENEEGQTAAKRLRKNIAEG